MFRQVLSGTVTWSFYDYILIPESANPDMMGMYLKLTVWNWNIAHYITFSNPSGRCFSGNVAVGHQAWVNALQKLGVSTSFSLFLAVLFQIPALWMHRGVVTERCGQSEPGCTSAQHANTAWQCVTRWPPLCTTVTLLYCANIHTMNEEVGVHPVLNMSCLWIKRLFGFLKHPSLSA